MNICSIPFSVLQFESHFNRFHEPKVSRIVLIYDPDFYNPEKVQRNGHSNCMGFRFVRILSRSRMVLNWIKTLIYFRTHNFTIIHIILHPCSKNGSNVTSNPNRKDNIERTECQDTYKNQSLSLQYRFTSKGY